MTEISRRKFIQLSVISTAIAVGASGCNNEAIWKQEATGQYGGMANKVYPYVDQPGGTIDGIPVYYATTCGMCGAGCGLYVRTMGGRAHKVEGNPNHPVNQGKTCLRGQLSLQHLYNPDRVMRPLMRSNSGGNLQEVDWETALTKSASALADAHGKAAILVDGVTIARSPTKMRLLQELSTHIDAKLIQFSLVDDSPWRAAAAACYGKDQIPDYRIDHADLVVSFGGNFLEAWPSPVYYGRLFGEFRQGAHRKPGSHGRFVYVGPRLSMTASRADIWLPCQAGTEPIVASAVLNEVGGKGVNAEYAAAVSGLSRAQILHLASLIKDAAGAFVAIPGDGLFSSASVTEAFAAVENLNVRMKSECVMFGEAMLPVENPLGGLRSLLSLVDEMKHGNIDTLMLAGQVNPAYHLPADANWRAAVAKVPTVISLTSFLDETSSEAEIVLASRTFLEEWSDQTPAVLPGGVSLASLTQPVIDPTYITKRHEVDSNNHPVPMMDTREHNDIVLALLSRLRSSSPLETGMSVVRRTWYPKLGVPPDAPDTDESWPNTVSRGGQWRKSHAAAVSMAAASAQDFSAQVPAQDGRFALLLFPHIYHDDGRHANLGWAQEMPDPMSSAVWNTWFEINASVAHELGIRTGDIVRLKSESGYVDGPAVPSPGIHPETVAMPIGQGHTAYGRNATEVGSNPLSILDITVDQKTGAFAFSATRVTLVKLRDAQAGFHAEQDTLVLVQDRPHGAEPPAVKNLIHETAGEWRSGRPGAESKVLEERTKPIL